MIWGYYSSIPVLGFCGVDSCRGRVVVIDEGTMASAAERIGHQIKALRTDRSLTQEDLSARFGTLGHSVSSKTISSWETGRTPLPLTMLAPLAEALKMDAGHLGQRLGLCGAPSPRDLHFAEGADILTELADEPPEVAETILRWLRDSVQIAKTARLARTN